MIEATAALFLAMGYLLLGFGIAGLGAFWLTVPMPVSIAVICLIVGAIFVVAAIWRNETMQS